MAKKISVRNPLWAGGLLWLLAATAAAADGQVARSMLATQDYAAAISELNSVLAERPENAQARFLKGLALARSGSTDAALALFETLATDHPEMAEVWNNLGVLRARNGNLAGAREALEKATAINPQHAPAQENLGDIYVALARQAYRKAGQLEPDNRGVSVKSRQLAELMSDAEPGSAARTVADTSTHTQGNPAMPQAPMSDPLPVAAEPAPDGDAATAPNDQSEKIEAVRAALLNWAQAWSAQNLEAYFNAYSDHFDPVGNRTLTAWSRLRNNRLTAPETIAVTLSNIDVTLTSPDSATVRFDQRYRSNFYQDRERKTVTMVRGSEGWVITSES